MAVPVIAASTIGLRRACISERQVERPPAQPSMPTPTAATTTKSTATTPADTRAASGPKTAKAMGRPRKALLPRLADNDPPARSSRVQPSATPIVTISATTNRAQAP
jgi:hypothetical protein